MCVCVCPVTMSNIICVNPTVCTEVQIAVIVDSFATPPLPVCYKHHFLCATSTTHTQTHNMNAHTLRKELVCLTCSPESQSLIYYPLINDTEQILYLSC